MQIYLYSLRLIEILHYLCSVKRKTVKIMETMQLRAELFREMNPLLDSEVMLRKTIDFIRSLYAAEQTQAKQQTLDKIDHSFGQLRQMQDGQLKGIKAEDLLNEL